MQNSGFTRREFLACSAVAAGAAGLAGPGVFAAAPGARGADLVPIGNTGLTASRLGLGTGTGSGREQRLLGSEGFTRLVHDAYDRGLRFIDCSDSYQIHGLVRRALEGLPREDFFLQTKTDARDPALARSDIDRYLVELGVDYVDSLLLHCMTAPGFVTDLRPVIDVLLEAKAAGMTRAIGASYHSLDALSAAVDCDALDIHVVRVNPFAQNTDAPMDQVEPVMRRHAEKGRGLIGIKVYGETGFGDREKRLESLRYAVSLDCLHAFAIGFSSAAQIDETLELIAEAAGWRAATADAPHSRTRDGSEAPMSLARTERFAWASEGPSAASPAGAPACLAPGEGRLSVVPGALGRSGAPVGYGGPHGTRL